MNRKIVLLALLAAVGGSLFDALLGTSRAEASQPPKPKFIFIILADGAGIAHLEIARQYSRHIHDEGMNITDIIFKQGSLGLITTHSAERLITDSAASATALSTGCKAKTTVIGICQDGRVPENVLEAARKRGLRVGLVTNASVYDASPAAFSIHVPSRNLAAEIVDAYLSLEPDLLMGGGRDRFLPSDRPGSRRRDRRDMIALFKKKGYAYASNKAELARAKGPRVLGLFSLRELIFEIDRDRDAEPSLSEMAAAALRILQEDNRSGFLLFIENENIDSAAHSSDVASLIHDLRELDRAVGLAYDFYRTRPDETLILVTSDHETGGLGLTTAAGRTGLLGRARRLVPSLISLERIHTIGISIARAAEILGRRPSRQAVDKLMAEHFRGFELPPRLKEKLVRGEPLGPTFYSRPVAAALGAMVAHNTQAHWLGRGHTHQPVFVGALGAGAERFRGYQDNTDFARHLLALLRQRGSP